MVKDVGGFRLRAWIFLFAACLETAAFARDPQSKAVLLDSVVATDGDFLILPVEVEGKTWSFFVDTGANVTALDLKVRDWLKENGHEPKAANDLLRTKSGFSDEAELYAPPKMTVKGTNAGAIPFPGDLAIVFTDLTSLRSGSRIPIAGVLGMDFLQAYALELDLSKGLLRLLDARLLQRGEFDGVIPFDIKRRQPLLGLDAGDGELTALIDTGFLGNIHIEVQTLRTLVKKKRVELINPKIKDANSVGIIEEIRLGPFSTKRVRFLPDDKSNLLGLYYWRRFHCVFDFPGETAYLNKSPLFDAADDSDHAGICMERAVEGTSPVVVGVIPKSDGEKAGVRAGDRLLSIDGKDVQFEKIVLVHRRLMFRHDRRCTLVLSRDGEEVRVVLPPSGE